MAYPHMKFIKHFWVDVSLLILMLIPIAGFYFMYQSAQEKYYIGRPADSTTGYISGQEPVANPNLKL